MTDIVVAVYGGGEYLQRCAAALRHTVDLTQHRIWFVDDCTPAHLRTGLKAAFDSLPEAMVIRNGINMGFSGTNNIGAAQGQSDYLCLLNSDTEPQPGWLAAMEKVLDEKPQVGLVGARLIFPPWSTDPRRPKGAVQHAGVVFNVDKLPYHIFAGWPAEHPKVTHPQRMGVPCNFFPAVTGACWLVRRAVYETLGGLDEKYTTGNFEDIAFCLRLADQLHLKVWYEPQALLWHYGSGSSNSTMAEKNMNIFLLDWRPKIEMDDWMWW